MYISYHGQDPYLEQWQTVVKPVADIFSRIFGGKKGPSESERIAAARSIAQQRLAAISDLPSTIRKIEGWLSHGSIYWECKQWEGRESTQGRACIIEACLVARKLGWDEPGFSDCNPLMKAPITFDRLEPLVLTYFRQRLPDLKATLVARRAPTPPPVIPPPIVTPPVVKPPIIPPVVVSPPPKPQPPPIVTGEIAPLPPGEAKSWWEKLLERVTPPPGAPGVPGAPGAPGIPIQAGLGGIDPNTLLIGGGVALGTILLSQGGRGRRRR